jgi:HSP20 family protein
MTTANVTQVDPRANQAAKPAAQPAPVRELRPRVDVYENADEVLMLADMPGASADTVNVRLEADQLTMQALRAQEGIRYRRAFQVPDTIDPEQVSAELKQGVLHVHLKKSEAAKPRTIPIRAL